MALQNTRIILQGRAGLDSIKLLLLMARQTRPWLHGVCGALLTPFIRNGEISIRYRLRDRRYRAFVRMSDENSDLLSLMELALRDIYWLDPAFAPDFVLDGGGNTGLFSLAAAAAFPQARIVVCEPVPANADHLQRHLNTNGVHAELRRVCIGGSRGAIPFYCREANQGSFDADKPYTSIMQAQVWPLKDLVSSDAKRVFIKLDIEGMEVEALQAYLPAEQREVQITGELHSHQQNKPIMEQLFRDHGWQLIFTHEGQMESTFFAQSPAAIRNCAGKAREGSMLQSA